MPFDKQQFRVLPEHITLLSKAYVGWDNCEYGAPAIDSKRPYGNSSVLRDIAKILQPKPDHPNLPAGDVSRLEYDDLYSEATLRRLDKLHRETETALQVFLHTGVMQPGLYESERYGGRWVRLAD